MSGAASKLGNRIVDLGKVIEENTLLYVNHDVDTTRAALRALVASDEFWEQLRLEKTREMRWTASGAGFDPNETDCPDCSDVVTPRDDCKKCRGTGRVRP
jgi:hypothetical protein